jgi:CheY-like chemotaxis protein
MAGPKHLLLVEDNDAHAKLLLTQFDGGDERFTVARVKDGEQAINYVYGQGEFAQCPRPDLILLDLHLPRLCGHEVARRVKGDATLRSIPIVVLSTSECEQDIHKAYASGVNSYLVKPMEFERFRRLAREVCAYWCTWNAAPRA